MRKLALCIMLCVLAGTVGKIRAEDENPNVWKPRTKSVAVFKNGLGFFVQEGSVKLKDGWCRGESVPPASFGTFAVYALDEGSAVDTIALGPGEIFEFDGRQCPDTLDARRNKLVPCKGLNLQLTYRLQGADTTAAGKLVSLSDEYAILQSAAATLAVPISDIRQMQVLDLPLRVHVGSAEDSETTQDGEPEVNLGMSYLRKGIVWIPEYSLTILDDQTAELTLRGTLVNEAEDLLETDVHLVVGVPHFIHTDFQSPFVAGQTIRSLTVNPQIMNRAQIPSQVMTQNIAMNSAPAMEMNVVQERALAEQTNIQSVLGEMPSFEQAGASDYTVYTRKNVTLRHGERAMMTLFSYKIPYSHIYRWTTTGQMGHALVLENTTPTAWTTGPCIAVTQTQALTEDLLKYVPKNACGELALTESINIGQSHTQAEISRELKALTIQNRSFDQVQLQGTIVLRNYEPRAVEIVVTAPIEGKALTADAEGAISQDASELRLTSRKSQIVWKLKLEPGATQTINYTYERYVESL